MAIIIYSIKKKRLLCKSGAHDGNSGDSSVNALQIIVPLFSKLPESCDIHPIAEKLSAAGSFRLSGVVGAMAVLRLRVWMSKADIGCLPGFRGRL